MYIYTNLKDNLIKIGVKKGDLLYIASDTINFLLQCKKSLSQTESNISNDEIKQKSLNGLIDVFIDVVGENGTILIPTFNFDFCKNQPFIYNETKSSVGILGDIALTRKDFKRSKHPIYSFAVYGKDKDFLTNLRNISAWGGDSPFAFMLHQYDRAKFVSIDINNEGQGLSFLHFVEEAILYEDRYHKKFTSTYIDENNNSSTKTYSMFVRDLDKNFMTLCTEKFLNNKGILKKSTDLFTIRLVNIIDAYNAFYDDLQEYKTKELIKEI